MVGAIGSLLRHIADEFSVAVLVTNHVVGGGGGGGGSGGGPDGGGGGGQGAAGGGFRPALGAQWRSQPHVRIQLSRGPAASGVVVATLVASMSRVRPAAPGGGWGGGVGRLLRGCFRSRRVPSAVEARGSPREASHCHCLTRPHLCAPPHPNQPLQAAGAQRAFVVTDAGLESV
jgi:hypothetical protein